MSATAVKEQPRPLGSFLNKLTPVPAEKKPAEPAKETADAPAKTQTPGADAGKPAGAVGEKPPAATVAESPETAVAGVESEKDGKDKTEKRLKDAQTWGNEEHKARLAAEKREAALAARLERIEKKLDGTYEEPTAPSLEQVTADADATGRIKASHHAAVRHYGEAFVMETVWNHDSPYQVLQAKDPQIRARVMHADDPVLEAIAVVKEDQDGAKYGRTPEEIRKKIEAELKPKLQQEILEGLKTKPGPATNTLGHVRGGTERTEQKNSAPNVLNLGLVFPHGASRR